MRHFDDYTDEMGRLGKVSEQEIERLLAGDRVDDGALQDLAAALREASDGLRRPPGEASRRSHLLAMAAATEELSSEPSEDAASRPAISRPTLWRRTMRLTWTLVSRAAAVGGALALSSLGLAYAGVDLPGTAAERAWAAVGLDLPNQASEHSVSDEVREVIEGSEDRGCEFGRAVADTASQGRGNGPDDDPCARGDDGGAEAQGGKETGDEKSADGRAKAAEKSGGRSEAGSDNAGTHDDAGRETASEKSGGASDGGSGNASGGKDTASEKSGGASDSGSGNASGGKDTASEKSGGASDSGSGSASGGKDTASEKSGGTSDRP